MIQAKYNTTVSLYTVLITAGTRSAQANPTLAAGDVQISKDGGAFANLTTLPDALPASGVQVRIQLSATEMSCKVATIRFKDQTSPAEWDEQFVQVFSYGNASAFTVFDFSQATPAVNATQFAGQTITAAAGVTLPSSVASPTNITAGTITTVTNLTNAPTVGDFTATMKTSIGDAMTTQGYTTTRAGYLDTLNGLVAAIWASATRTLTSFGTLAADVWTVGTRQLTGTQAFNLTGNITGNLSGSVGSVTGGVIVTTNNDKTGYELTAGERTAIGTAVWATTVRTLTSMSGMTTDANIVSIDGQLTNGNNATLNLKKLNIVNSFGSALVAQGTAHGIEAVSSSSGCGILAQGAGTSPGIKADGNISGNGMECIGGPSGIRHGLALFKGATAGGQDLFFGNSLCTVPVVTSVTNTVDANLTKVDGVALATHVSGKVPADAVVSGTADANLVSIDGQLTNGNNATLKLKSLDIRNTAGNAVYINSTNNYGIEVVSGSSIGIYAHGNTGIYAAGVVSGITCEGGANGSGIVISGGTVSGSAVAIYGHGAGIDIQVDGKGIAVIAGDDAVYLLSTAAVGLSIQGLTNDVVADIFGSISSVTGNVGGNVVGYVGGVWNDVGITQAAADKVWATTVRTLTSYGTLVADTTTAIWSAGTRTLTSFGTLVADTAAAVWAYVSRTLTSSPITPANIWSHTGRSLDTTADANVVTIDGEVTAAQLLALSADTMVDDTVNDDDFIPTTEEFEVETIVDADLSHYRDRWVIFISGPLNRQARLIKNYSLEGTKGHFVCDAFTQEPAAGDRFIIV